MGRMVQRNINLVAVNRYQSHCRGNVQIDTKNADRILAQDPQKLPLCIVFHNLCQRRFTQARSFRDGWDLDLCGSRRNMRV